MFDASLTLCDGCEEQPKVTTTLAIYTHLFDDDHAETMAALGAMDRQPVADVGNVVALRAPL